MSDKYTQTHKYDFCDKHDHDVNDNTGYACWECSYETISMMIDERNKHITEIATLKARVQELAERVRPLLKQVDLLVKKLIIQRARGQLMLDWEKDLIEVHRYYTYSRQLEAMQGVLKEGCDE